MDNTSRCIYQTNESCFEPALGCNAFGTPEVLAKACFCAGPEIMAPEGAGSFSNASSGATSTLA
jgi:hypothetical protein